MNKSIRYACIFVLGSMTNLGSQNAMAAPFVPSDESQILEKLQTTPINPATRELRHKRAQLLAQPDNLPLAVQVARRYIGQARAEADPRYLGYAQGVLAPWWKMERPPSQVLVLRAIINQSNHNFKDALADLSLVLQREPNNAQAWLTRASIFRVVGSYQKASHDCLKLLRLTNEIISANCISGVAGQNGKLLESYNLLLGVFKKSPATELSPDEKLWVLIDLAEMAARAGRKQAAETHYQAALALNIQDSYLLGAYSDFLLDQGRPEEVISLLKDKVRADGLLLRLALAEQRLNLPSLPTHVAALGARFEASRLRGDIVHRREEARFTLVLLKNPQLALKLAQENWMVQRELWDARLVLEAAIAAQRYSEARVVLAWLAENHLEDIQIARHVQLLNSVTL